MTTTKKNNPTILVIDDDVMICEILERMLSEVFEVTAMSDPKEVLGKINELKYDIVMTDFMMPHVSGLDIADRVKEVSPETPVILITANGNVDEKIKQALNNKTFDEMISKPFDLENMVKRLETYL